MIKLIAFDLDGTLTQHKTKLEEKNRAVLEKLAKKYYEYASHLADSVTRMENILSGISVIIMDADKKQQYNLILLCDQILTSYGNIKTAISNFATQNEHLIAMDTLSVSDMIKLHAELSYKFSYFKNFLTQHRR